MPTESPVHHPLLVDVACKLCGTVHKDLRFRRVDRPAHPKAPWMATCDGGEIHMQIDPRRYWFVRRQRP